MLKHRLSMIAVSAAALVGTLSMAAPASAATYNWQSACNNTWYSYTYRIAQPTYQQAQPTWYTWRLIPSGTTTTATVAPKMTQPTTVAPKVTQPAPAPVAPKATPAPTTQSSAPTSTATQSAAGLTANEQQMLNSVNAERSKLGLLPLKADLQLTKLARMKSQDMIAKNYFSHQSPTYGSPFDMMQKYGVSYQTAGENIAGNGSVSGAHTSLMNSPGHRANILNKAYTHVGIGIVNGGQYGMMFTQMFVGR